MQRYFIPPHQFGEIDCEITGQDARHLIRVLRAKPGDEIICCDGLGRSARVKITRLGREVVYGQVLEELQEERELPIEVTIAQSLPKGDKMDWIVQKGTELGVHRFLPFVSERTVVKYDRVKAEKKRVRWQAIAKEAAEQSHRQRLPHVEEVTSLAQLAQVEATVKLVADEELSQQFEESLFLQNISRLKPGDQLLVAIGPEGGFSRVEISQLAVSGFVPISLGKRILRTETASLYVMAVLVFYLEQKGG